MKLFLVMIVLFATKTIFALERNSSQYIGGSWSPYLVGALIGLLVCFTLVFSDKPVGASSFYATVAGLIGKAIAPNHTMKLQYYRDNPPQVNWEFAFVLAIILGAAIAALHGGEFGLRGMPEMWVDHYGNDSLVQYITLSFFGGVLIAFGSRLAGGCTSGHGISGTSQLSVSSWLSVICFFIGGILAIQFIY